VSFTVEVEGNDLLHQAAAIRGGNRPPSFCGATPQGKFGQEGAWVKDPRLFLLLLLHCFQAHKAGFDDEQRRSAIDSYESWKYVKETYSKEAYTERPKLFPEKALPADMFPYRGDVEITIPQTDPRICTSDAGKDAEAMENYREWRRKQAQTGGGADESEAEDAEGPETSDEKKVHQERDLNLQLSISLKRSMPCSVDARQALITAFSPYDPGYDMRRTKVMEQGLSRSQKQKGERGNRYFLRAGRLSNGQFISAVRNQLQKELPRIEAFVAKSNRKHEGKETVRRKRPFDVGSLLRDKQRAAEAISALYHRVVAMQAETRGWEQEEEGGEEGLGDKGRNAAQRRGSGGSTRSRINTGSVASDRSGRSAGSGNSDRGGSNGGSSASSTNTFIANQARSADGAAIVDIVDGILRLYSSCPESEPAPCHSRYSGFDPQASQHRNQLGKSSRAVEEGRGWGAEERIGGVGGGLQEVEESDAACDIGDPDAAVRAAQRMRWQHGVDRDSSGFCHEGGAGAAGGRSGGGSMGACVGGKGPRSRANRQAWMGYGDEREERMRRVEANGASQPSGGFAHAGREREGQGFGFGERGGAVAKAVENFDGGLQATWANKACAATIARKEADDAAAEAAAAGALSASSLCIITLHHRSASLLCIITLHHVPRTPQPTPAHSSAHRHSCV
jgi:hypothetical protein